MRNTHEDAPECLLDLATAPGELREMLVVEDGAVSSIRPVETLGYDETAATARASELCDVLSLLAGQRRPGEAGLGELQRLGKSLFELLIAPQIRKRLAERRGGYLTLLLDEALAFLPWETLHDGEDFLCRRFALGRLVRTGLATGEIPPPPAGRSMLIVANPTGDLPGAQAEAAAIRTAMESVGGGFRIHVPTSGVSRLYLRDNLAAWDLIHFSGHAAFNPGAPAESGLVLSDGIFSALDVREQLAAGAKAPALVFVNGCVSGRSDARARQLSLLNLSNALLLGGVRHFIGTIAEAPDELAGEFAAHFYRALAGGESAGAALQRARTEVMTRRPEWATGALSYLLYGDPRRSPLAGEARRKPENLGARSKVEVIRCASCGREVLSRLAAHACEACGRLICASCWVGRGVRQCPQHRRLETGAAHMAGTGMAVGSGKAPPGERSAVKASRAASVGAPGRERRCGQCGRLILAGSGAAPCVHEGCRELICERCQRWLDRRQCQAHTLGWTERVSHARQWLAEGRIGRLLDREAAARREALYFREVRERLGRRPALIMDHAKYALDAASLAEGASEQELSELLGRISDGAAIAKLCPRNLSLTAKFKQDVLWGDGRMLELRLAVLSDLERQVYPGFETEPLGPGPILRRLSQSGAALRPGVQLVDALASTSGWSAEARALVVDGTAGELRQESGRAVALVDLETDEVLHAAAAPLPPELLDLVRPSPRMSVAAEVDAYIRQTLTVGEFLTAAELAERFHVQPAQICVVFEALERTGDYAVREAPGVGRVITKTYGS